MLRLHKVNKFLRGQGEICVYAFASSFPITITIINYCYRYVNKQCIIVAKCLAA